MSNKKSIEWQLNIEPGEFETTKYCPDCNKERGISAFRVKPGTNQVLSKYCRVHESERNAAVYHKNKQAYDDAYERAKNG